MKDMRILFLFAGRYFSTAEFIYGLWMKTPSPPIAGHLIQCSPFRWIQTYSSPSLFLSVCLSPSPCLGMTYCQTQILKISKNTEPEFLRRKPSMLPCPASCLLLSEQEIWIWVLGGKSFGLISFLLEAEDKSGRCWRDEFRQNFCNEGVVVLCVVFCFCF